jgi:hypothetical protein
MGTPPKVIRRVLWRLISQVIICVHTEFNG